MHQLEPSVELSYDWLDFSSLNYPEKPDDGTSSQGSDDKRSEHSSEYLASDDLVDDIVKDLLADDDALEENTVKARQSHRAHSGKLESREILDGQWEEFWEFGQVACHGPAWLKDPDYYTSIDGDPAYDYVHDDLDGDDEVIYVVDMGFEDDHKVSTSCSALSWSGAGASLSLSLNLSIYTSHPITRLTDLEEFRNDPDKAPRIEPLLLDFEFGAREKLRSRHGTQVAAMAGGNTMGIARKSTLVIFPARPSHAPDPRRKKNSLINHEYFIHGILAVLDDLVEYRGARDSSVLNMSWGVPVKQVPEAFVKRMCK